MNKNQEHEGKRWCDVCQRWFWRKGYATHSKTHSPAAVGAAEKNKPNGAAPEPTAPAAVSPEDRGMLAVIQKLVGSPDEARMVIKARLDQITKEIDQLNLEASQFRRIDSALVDRPPAQSSGHVENHRPQAVREN